MNADEVVDLIDVMSAAWPWAEWSGKQADLWCGTLAPLDRHDATVAVKKAVTTLEKPPSLAWVIGEARAEAERRTPNRPALPEPPVNIDRRAELMASMRKMLDEPKPHDHHQGWEGCATCTAAVKRDGLHPNPSKQHLATIRAALAASSPGRGET